MKIFNTLLKIFILFSLFVSCSGDEESEPQYRTPTVETSVTSSITGTSATSAGDVTNDGGTNVTARGVCWSTSPNPTTSNNNTSNGVGMGIYTSYLTDLIENTTYFVRAYATNNEGTSYGNQEQFTTQYQEYVFKEYVGNVHLTNYEEVQAFGVNNYTSITGNLSIELDSNTNNDLTLLLSLNSIGGNLTIINCYALPHIDGLSNITFVGGVLVFVNSDALTSIDELSNLSSVGGSIVIENNDALTSINGLSNLSSVGGSIAIGINNALTSIDGLNNLSSVGGDIIIGSNYALVNVDGLSNITTVGEHLSISNNHALTNIDGLSNIASLNGDLQIVDNDALTNIDGLSNLGSVEFELLIRENDALTNLCGITDLITNNGLLGNYSVYNNAYNPTQQDIIDGNCSQ